MPHVVVLYATDLEREADWTRLCRRLAATLVAQRDEAGEPVFPVGGTRVFALRSDHHAVADGSVGDAGFVYVNLRIAPGRPAAVVSRTGDALLAVAQDELGPLFAARPTGLTLQIDECPGQVYDGKAGSLRAALLKAP